MSFPDVRSVRPTWERGTWARWSFVRAIKALFLSKLADAGTTAIGLLFFPVREGNPVSHRVIAEVGIVSGIAVVSLLGIAIVVATTEAGVRLVASIGADRRWIPRIRLVGYGFPALLWGLVSIHNGVLILLSL